MSFSNRRVFDRIHTITRLSSLERPLKIHIIGLYVWRVQKGHQIPPSDRMQLELTIGMVIRSQDATADFVSKLRLDESVSTKLQAIIKKELHTRVRMGITGMDGDMVMSEIWIIVKLVLKGAATQRGELHRGRQYAYVG